MIAVVMSQSLRVAHCRAYLDLTDTPAVAIVSNSGVFGPEGPRPGVEVVVTGVADGGSWRERLRSRFLGWSRGGSLLGPSVEALIRGILSVRPESRRQIPRPHSGPDLSNESDLTQTPVYRALVAAHGRQPLDLAVVFDLYDLPATLAFAGQRGVRVEVR